jgi:hypothetical protein
MDFRPHRRPYWPLLGLPISDRFQSVTATWIPWQFTIPWTVFNHDAQYHYGIPRIGDEPQMALADPQSVTYDGTAYSLGRISSGLNSGSYQAFGTNLELDMNVSHHMASGHVESRGWILRRFSHRLWPQGFLSLRAIAATSCWTRPPISGFMIPRRPQSS